MVVPAKPRRPPGVVIRTRSLRRLRLSGQLLRHLVTGAAIAGLAASARFALFPPAAPRSAPVVLRAPDPASAGFAELFARRYLTWDAGHPAQHAASLTTLVGSGMDPDAGLRLPSAGSEHVGWSAIVQERAGSSRERVYTVALETDSAGLLYLSVSVSRDDAGRLTISRYPSLVGPPAADPARPEPTGPQTQDPALSAVVARALRNYLAGSTSNLAADLAPGARVAEPTVALSLERVLDLHWSSGPGSVVADVEAQDGRGADFTFSYELDVDLSQHRWEISAIQMDPTA